MARRRVSFDDRRALQDRTFWRRVKLGVWLAMSAMLAYHAVFGWMNGFQSLIAGPHGIRCRVSTWLMIDAVILLVLAGYQGLGWLRRRSTGTATP